MARVGLQGVRKIYPGGVEAVRGVDLSIQHGEFCVLVGPSGCGKSTLLRMIAGLEAVSSGSIVIGDRVVNDLEPAERDIAMVFQNYALYPHMSVYDNIAYGLRNRGMPKPEIARRVAEAARVLDIEAVLARRPRALSGGQRQRVAMGRAIVRDPQVFLFDEPLSNLDAKLRVQMRVEIKRLQRSLGVTSVYVTHDQIEAMTLSDRLVVMNGGRIEQIGAPGEVYRRPASRFVATFIGSPPMNIVPGVVEGPDRVSIGDASLPVAYPGVAARGQSVDIGIRPEDVAVVAGPGEGRLAFAVEFVEELGATQLFHGRIGGAPFVLQAPTGAIGASPRPTHLAVSPDALHLFDADTGRRLDDPAEPEPVRTSRAADVIPAA